MLKNVQEMENFNDFRQISRTYEFNLYLRFTGQSKNGSSPSYWLSYMITLNSIYPAVFFIFGNGLNTLIGVVYSTINDGKSRTKYMPVISLTNMIALNLCLLNQYDFVLDLQVFFNLKYKCLIIAYLVRFVTSIGSSVYGFAGIFALLNVRLSRFQTILAVVTLMTFSSVDFYLLDVVQLDQVHYGCVVSDRRLLVARNWIDFLTVLILPVSINYLTQIYIILKIFRSKKRLNLGLPKFFINNIYTFLSGFVIMPLVYCSFIAPVVLLPLFGTFYDHKMDHDKLTFFRFMSVMVYQFYFLITFVFGLVHNHTLRLKLIELVRNLNKCQANKRPASTRNLLIVNNSSEKPL